MLEGRQHSGRLVHFLPCFFPIKTEEHKRRRGLNKGAEKRGGRSKEKKKETEKRTKKKTRRGRKKRKTEKHCRPPCATAPP